MIEHEIGIRIYSREYCLELFPAKWREYAPTLPILRVIPWMLVVGGFSKALKTFYQDGVFVAKLLGQHNNEAATKAFLIGEGSFNVCVTLRFENGVKWSAGANTLRFLKQSEALKRFQETSEILGFKWDTVVTPLTGLLDNMYHETQALVLLEADPLNAEVLRLGMEDDEAVDLKLRINA